MDQRMQFLMGVHAFFHKRRVDGLLSAQVGLVGRVGPP